jgi:hypothetical protein
MNWVSISQKTTFFIVSAVETSNLTQTSLFNCATASVLPRISYSYVIQLGHRWMTYGLFAFETLGLYTKGTAHRRQEKGERKGRN